MGEKNWQRPFLKPRFIGKPRFPLPIITSGKLTRAESLNFFWVREPGWKPVRLNWANHWPFPGKFGSRRVVAVKPGEGGWVPAPGFPPFVSSPGPWIGPRGFRGYELKGKGPKKALKKGGRKGGAQKGYPRAPLGKNIPRINGPGINSFSKIGPDTSHWANFHSFGKANKRAFGLTGGRKPGYGFSPGGAQNNTYWVKKPRRGVWPPAPLGFVSLPILPLKIWGGPTGGTRRWGPRAPGEYGRTTRKWGDFYSPGNAFERGNLWGENPWGEASSPRRRGGWGAKKEVSAGKTGPLKSSQTSGAARGETSTEGPGFKRESSVFSLSRF